MKKILGLAIVSIIGFSSSAALAGGVTIDNRSDFCVRTFVGSTQADHAPGAFTLFTFANDALVTFTQFRTSTCGGSGLRTFQMNSGNRDTRSTVRATNTFLGFP